MSSWSTRRKSLYGLVIVIALAVLIGVPVFNIFYEAPSCSDGTKNGDEQGVDCGGSCTKLCNNAFVPLAAPSWVRFREVAPGTYNVAAYIVNPNPKAGAESIPYQMSIFDKSGIDLARFSGTFDIYAGRNTVIFVNGVTIRDQPPARAIVQYTSEPEWIPGTDKLAGLETSGQEYIESETESSAQATLSNRTATTMRNIVVFVILKDADNNVVDFSKTIIDEIAPQKQAVAPFTWPDSHEGRVISLEVLAVPE